MKSDAYIHVSQIEALIKPAKAFIAWSPANGAVSGYAWDLQQGVNSVEASIKSAELQSVRAYYERLKKGENSISPDTE